MKKYSYQMIIFAIFISIFSTTAFGLLEPSSVYCQNLGYTWTVEKVQEGEIGICIFPDASRCPSDDFLTGKCKPEYSYCTKNDYQIKTVSGSVCSSLPLHTECSVCVLGNGTEVEVTKLMNISLNEGSCGDGRCIMGEDCANCQKDCGCTQGYVCQKGECIEAVPICSNNICEASENCTTCPQDCNFCQVKVTCGNNACEPGIGETFESCPQDCKEAESAPMGTNIIIAVSIALVIVALAVILIYRKRRGKVQVVFENQPGYVRAL